MNKQISFEKDTLVIAYTFSEEEMKVIQFAKDNKDIRFDLQDDQEQSIYPSELKYRQCKTICKELHANDIMECYEPDEGTFFGEVYALKHEYKTT